MKHPQAQKKQALPTATRSWEEGREGRPQGPRKEQASTLTLDPSLQCVVICDLRSHRTLIYDHFFHSWIWRLPGLQAVLTLGPSRISGRMAETGGHHKGFLEHMPDTGVRRLKQLGMWMSWGT